MRTDRKPIIARSILTHSAKLCIPDGRCDRISLRSPPMLSLFFLNGRLICIDSFRTSLPLLLKLQIRRTPQLKSRDRPFLSPPLSRTSFVLPYFLPSIVIPFRPSFPLSLPPHSTGGGTREGGRRKFSSPFGSSFLLSGRGSNFPLP